MSAGADEKVTASRAPASASRRRAMDDAGAHVTDPDGPDFVPPPLPVGVSPDGGELGELFGGLDPNRVVVRAHTLKARAKGGTTSGPSVAVDLREPADPEAHVTGLRGARRARRKVLVAVAVAVLSVAVLACAWAIGVLGARSAPPAAMRAPAAPASPAYAEPPAQVPASGSEVAAEASRVAESEAIPASPEPKAPTLTPAPTPMMPRRTSPRAQPHTHAPHAAASPDVLPDSKEIEAPSAPVPAPAPSAAPPAAPVTPLRHGSLVKGVTP
ncbi:hypothetical protein [Pendulispora albinea]|uniref:Uncharacterized protein n=1 Tax=Pendulispora albinea TaxID=2741071 RepID=A0ABZ2MBG4_9BACT